mmetsp:Transcript_6143/g.12142  ORF Transcript_6143/g.12142 Transcript_6143/m.12142 type:complete len:84 (+) Transcript_6143:3-254(+)
MVGHSIDRGYRDPELQVERFSLAVTCRPPCSGFDRQHGHLGGAVSVSVSVSISPSLAGGPSALCSVFLGCGSEVGWRPPACPH